MVNVVVNRRPRGTLSELPPTRMLSHLGPVGCLCLVATISPEVSLIFRPQEVQNFKGWGVQRNPKSPKMTPKIWSCWCFQPIWKMLYSQNRNLPQIGVKIKNIWNHHLVMAVFDPLTLTSLRISRDLKSRIVGTGDPKTNRSSESNPSMGEPKDS